MITRRSLLAACGLAFGGLAVAAFERDALARGPKKLATAAALRRAIGLAEDIRRGAASNAQWQSGMATLWTETDAAELLKGLEVDRLMQGRPLAARGASVVVVPWWRFLPDAQAPKGFAVKIFAFGAGRANPPHAHEHMVSTHVVLRGAFRAVHHDLVRSDAKNAWLRPSLDRRLKPGESTSIAPDRDAVHAHRTETGGLLLDVVVADLGGATNTPLVDMRAAEKDGDTLRAPWLDSVEVALERYG